MKPSFANAFAALPAGSILLAASLTAHADTIYWDGNGALVTTSATWGDVANWSTTAAGTSNPLVIPSAADDLIFNITSANTLSFMNLNADQAANSLTFNSTGGVQIVNNGVTTPTQITTARNLTLGAGGITVNSTAGAAYLGVGGATYGSLNVVINTSQSWTNNSANGLFLYANNNNTAATIAAGQVLTFAGSGPITIGQTANSANIMGTGGIAMSGSGVLTLFNAGTFSGGTTLNSGTIAVGNVNALGTGGTLTINGGTIRSDSGSARSLAGKLTGITVNSDFTLGAASAVGLLTFDAPINLGSSTRTITVNSSVTLGATAAGVISGGTGVGIIKNGTGALTISGTTAHTFDGGLTVNGGSVSLTYGNMTTPSNLLVSGSPVVLANSSSLNVNGKPSVATTQTLGGLTVGGGRNTLSVAAGSSSTIGLTLGNTWTRNDQGALHVVLNTTTGVTITSSPTLTNGIVGPWATIYQAAAPAGTYYATVSGGAVVPLTGGANFTSIAQSSGLTDTGGTMNYDLTAVGTSPNDTVGAGFIGNTIRFTGAAGNTKLGGSFSVNGLLNNTANLWTIGTGTLTIGATKELVVQVAGNGGIALAGTVIEDNVGGASGLTLAGTNTGMAAITLNPSNTYTGTTTINGSNTFVTAGHVVANTFANTGTASPFGKGDTVVLNGATILTTPTSAQSTNRSMTWNGNSGFYSKASLIANRQVTFSGNISGSGTFNIDHDFTAGGAGTENAALVLSGNNEYSGEIQFQTDGRLVIDSSNALKNATLNISGQRIALFLKNDHAFNIGSLKGNGQNVNLGAATANGGSGFVTIGANNLSNEFLGELSGSAGLIKDGTGTQTLVKNSYTGATIVTNGTLKLGTATANAFTGAIALDGGWSGSRSVLTMTVGNTTGLAVGQVVPGTGGLVITAIESSTKVALNSSTYTKTSYTDTFAAMNGSLASTTIEVKAGAYLDATALVGGFTLASTQTLKGGGTVQGSMTVGGTLSPGSSPGTMNTGSETWLNGGDYNWQILDATGAAGTGYDTMAVTGTLDLSALTAGGFNINLWSLVSTGPDVNGNAINFNNAQTYDWTILTTTGGITGFEAADFTLNTGIINGTGGFTNALGTGTLELAKEGNNLVLKFVPEPSALLLSSLGLLALARRRR